MVLSILELARHDDTVIPVKSSLASCFSFLVISPIYLSAWKIAYALTFRHTFAEGADYKSVLAGIQDSFSIWPLTFITKHVLC